MLGKHGVNQAENTVEQKSKTFYGFLEDNYVLLTCGDLDAETCLGIKQSLPSLMSLQSAVGSFHSLLCW